MKAYFGIALRKTRLTEFAIGRGLNRARVGTLTLAVAILGSVSIAWTQQNTPTATAAVSRIHQLVIEDQSESPGNISEEEHSRRVDARIAEVRKLLADGKLTTGEDFSEASLIFQHGQTSAEFLFAHILAVEALTHGSSDKWLTAATLDRYLQSVNQPQVFGTQYSGVKSSENTPKPLVDPRVLNIQRTLQPYDSKFLPDFIRQDFCVPDFSQQEKNLTVFNTGHRPERKLMRATTCPQ